MERRASEELDRQETWYAAHLPLRDQVIVDVGANVGKLSQFFWEQGKRTNTVISVEPMPENVKAIEARIKAAKAGSKWTVKRCAISAKDGHVRMRRLTAQWGLNSMVPVGEEADTIAIACRRLEALAPDATVVKVDVEGHEYAFLPTAVPALPAVKAWALELHCVEGERLEDTLRLFVDHGYRLLAGAAKKTDPDGPWVSVPAAPEWSWAQIGGIPTVKDGLPSTFKMLHVLALK